MAKPILELLPAVDISEGYAARSGQGGAHLGEGWRPLDSSG